MMILAVNIVGDRASHGYQFRSRAYRKKPSLGHNDLQEILQARTRLHSNPSGFPVEIENPIERRAVDEIALVVEARIPVAAPQAVGQHRCRLGLI